MAEGWCNCEGKYMIRREARGNPSETRSQSSSLGNSDVQTTSMSEAEEFREALRDWSAREEFHHGGSSSRSSTTASSSDHLVGSEWRWQAKEGSRRRTGRRPSL